MSYRPPNWNSEKIMDDVLANHYPHDCSMFGITINKFFIEAGADAMLEALKAKGIQGKVDSTFWGNTIWMIGAKGVSEFLDAHLGEKGWLIFIPEEAE